MPSSRDSDPADVLTLSSPNDAAVRALFERDLSTFKVLRLTAGMIGDEGALHLLLGLRDRPHIERVELDRNRIGVPGLRALALLGDRVVPGRQENRGPALDMIPEEFEPLPSDDIRKLATKWTEHLPALLGRLLRETGHDPVGQSLRAAWNASGGGAFGPYVDALEAQARHFAAQPRTAPLAELLEITAEAFAKYGAGVYQGEVGSDFGLGFIAYAEATALVLGSLRTAHPRGPIALWSDGWSLAQLSAEVEELKAGVALFRDLPASIEPVVPAPPTLSNDDLLETWLKAWSLADVVLAARLFALTRDDAAITACLEGVTLENGCLVGGGMRERLEKQVNAHFLLHLIAFAPATNERATVLRNAATKLEVNRGSGGIPFDAALLGRFQALKELRLSGRSDGLQALKFLSSLETVVISGPVLDLTWVPPHVRRLEFEHLVQLRGAERCSALKHLKFTSSLHDLGPLEGLRLGWLEAAVVGEPALVSILAQTELRALRLKAPDLHDSGRLSRLTKLEYLHLSAAPEGVSLKGLSLPNLVSLHPYSKLGPASEAELPRLRFLAVWRPSTIGEFPLLEALSLTALSDEFPLTFLSEFPKLKALRLSNASLPDDRLAPLRGHEALETLSLAECQIESLDFAKTIPRLRVLDLVGTKSTVPKNKLALEALNGLPLKAVRVTASHVVQKGLKKPIKDVLESLDQTQSLRDTGQAWPEQCGEAAWLASLAESVASTSPTAGP